jgi:serine/threonine-protein kinase
MPYAPGDTLLDQYKIEALIGQGSFGDVYRVTHQTLRVHRAIKVLRRDAPGIGSTIYQNTQQRFQLEAQLGARLHIPTPNPHLLQVQNFIIREDLLVLEMEYAAGGSLSERIQKLRESNTPFALGAALQIAAEIAAGLAALHKLDIVHRDLKPANILFDEHGHARLADLGLAQMPGGPSRRSQLSDAPAHPGTPEYMSPEQENTTKYLASSSDIYSLGVTLFEMLSGRIYHNLRPGTPPSKFRADLPQEVDDLLAKMLAENPKERLWDGEETAVLLNETLASLKAGNSAELARKEAEEQAKKKTEAEALERARLAQEAERKAQAELEELARIDAQKKAEAQAREQARIQEEAKRKAEELAQEAERKRRELIIELAPGVTMEFVRVPAGEFLMGSDRTKDKEASNDETPQHKVMLNEYLIGKTPVTNKQYQAFVQATGHKQPEHWKNGGIPNSKQEHPVVQVSWQDGVAFCAWASKVSGQEVRLPSEAEWEKAARGEDGRIYPWGDQSPDKNHCNYVGNFFSIFPGGTTPVGKYSPIGDSSYGCVDMAGNVWEWVNDWYDKKYYQASPGSNPSGPASGTYRVMRGGSWDSLGIDLRVSYRYWGSPVYWNYLGFRCAR